MKTQKVRIAQEHVQAIETYRLIYKSRIRRPTAQQREKAKKMLFLQNETEKLLKTLGVVEEKAENETETKRRVGRKPWLLLSQCIENKHDARLSKRTGNEPEMQHRYDDLER